MKVLNPTPERLRIAERLSRRSRTTPSGCIEIVGFRSRGYGQFSIASGASRRRSPAHIIAYELYVGDVPEGKELHHECENKACINPDHLKPLTHAEHIRLHDNATSRHADKTHCVNGHEFTPENIYFTSDGRACLACRRQRSREWIRENREKARLACMRYRAKKRQEKEPKGS